MTDSLIAKLEAAAEGSRELDAEICLEIRSYPKDWATTLPGYSLEYFIAWSGCAPQYTTSLDVALSLVPEGCVWDVTSTGLAWVDPGAIESWVNAKAATPALALCIAALKARSQS